ncbi:MAG: hypothetical protein KCHDKBKB_00681 [Elusimicrobia bacterium]|nr:hypothetical protein [Elusimicrobiota bacterium]
MKAIDGHLPINCKYTAIKADYLGDNFCTCQNCDLPINLVVTLRNESGECFDVGSDCAEALQGVDSIEYWKTKQVAKVARQTRSYVAKLRKAKRENRLEVGEKYWVIYPKPLDTLEENIWNIRGNLTSRAYQLFIGGIK